jgi:CheY-like chemotaxis protein
MRVAVSADVAVLDLVMPRGDGLVTMARMRANQELREVPVVVVVPGELLPEEMAELQLSVDHLPDLVDVLYRSTVSIMLEACDSAADPIDAAI